MSEWNGWQLCVEIRIYDPWTPHSVREVWRGVQGKAVYCISPFWRLIGKVFLIHRICHKNAYRKILSENIQQNVLIINSVYGVERDIVTRFIPYLSMSHHSSVNVAWIQQNIWYMICFKQEIICGRCLPSKCVFHWHVTGIFFMWCFLGVKNRYMAAPMV